MTICIAASTQVTMIAADTAWINADPAIVLCTDLQGSSDSSGAETLIKTEPMPFGFAALIAGPSSDAREFVEAIRGVLEETPLSEDRPYKNLRLLRKAVARYRRRCSEAHIGVALGISYTDFRTNGKTQLPDDLYASLSWEVRNHRSGVEVLLAGFLKAKVSFPGITPGLMYMPVIYKISEDHVWVCDHFGVIGSGTSIGESSLYCREHTTVNGLDRTLYNVYEAKRLSEKAPGVGRKTSLSILRPPAGDGVLPWEIIRQGGIDLLESQFQRYGPQPIKGLEAIPQEHRFTRITRAVQLSSTHDPSSEPPLLE
jgi:hypothetical protein